MPSQIDELSPGAERRWPGLTGLPAGPPTIAPWLGVGGDEPAPGAVPPPDATEPAHAPTPPPTSAPLPHDPEPPTRRGALYALLGVFAVAAIAAALVAGLTVHHDEAAAPPLSSTPSTTNPPSRVTPPSSTTPPSTTPSPSTPNGTTAPGRQNRTPTSPGQNSQNGLNGQNRQSGPNGQSGQNGQNGQSPSSPSTTTPGGGSSSNQPAAGNQAFLGVEVSTATSGGAQVEQVESGTPAATAGLKAGDVITAADGTSVGSADDLVAALEAHAPGDKLTLTVDDSSGAERTVSVTLGSH